VIGLNDIPEKPAPAVEIVYYAYHIMVGLGRFHRDLRDLRSSCGAAGFESRGVLWR